MGQFALPSRAKVAPRAEVSPPSEFDFTEFSPGQPDGDIGGGSCVEWGGSWVLRPSCRERGLKLGWPSSGKAQLGRSQAVYYAWSVLQTELMDGATPVPINSSGLPSSPLALLFSAQLFLGRWRC